MENEFIYIYIIYIYIYILLYNINNVWNFFQKRKNSKMRMGNTPQNDTINTWKTVREFFLGGGGGGDFFDIYFFGQWNIYIFGMKPKKLCVRFVAGWQKVMNQNSFGGRGGGLSMYIYIYIFIYIYLYELHFYDTHTPLLLLLLPSFLFLPHII